jgi:ribosome recycling factor
VFKDVKLEENNQKKFEQVVNQRMDESVKHFTHTIAGIRAGRAHPGMVEDVKVSCYGGTTEMRLKELATITAPDATLLVLQPWDKTTLPEIEKAIMMSDVGITPQNDGNIIRLQLPELSSERREELVKLLGKRQEEGKIALRNIRKEAHNLIRDSKKNKVISEDFENRLTDVLQKITDKWTEDINQITSKKEKEIKSR